MQTVVSQGMIFCQRFGQDGKEFLTLIVIYKNLFFYAVILKSLDIIKPYFRTGQAFPVNRKVVKRWKLFRLKVIFFCREQFSCQDQDVCGTNCEEI